MSPLRRRLLEMETRQPFLFPAQSIPDKFRHAAVLILLWEEAGIPHTLLTVRASHLSSFAGQVCFPGGRLDSGEDFQQAALRETDEEVGIATPDIEIIGRLDDAWSGGGYLMVPFVGFLSQKPQATANAEVARILSLRLDDALQVGEEEREVEGMRYTQSVIDCDGERVFGLTADLLLEAVEMLKRENTGRGATRLKHLQSFATRYAQADSNSI
jgi:8-oxo-dGTP pyrophosphatase MutT (NUDIX family)